MTTINVTSPQKNSGLFLQRMMPFLLMGGIVLSLAWLDKDNFVTVSDTRGVAKNTPVIWLDAPGKPDVVGSVTKITPHDEGHAIYFTITEHSDMIRSDVRACPMVDTKTLRIPCLYLIGGTDETVSVLQGGQIQEMPIQEITTEEPLPPPDLLKWLVFDKKILIPAAIALVIIWFVWKVIKKIILIVLLIIAVLAVVYGTHIAKDWSQLKERVSPYIGFISIEDIQTKVGKNVDQLIRKIPDSLLKHPDTPKNPEKKEGWFKMDMKILSETLLL